MNNFSILEWRYTQESRRAMHSVWPLLRLYTRLQGVFMKPFRLLEDTCHQFDLQLAYTYQEESSSSSSFTKYAEELHSCRAEAQDS